MHKGNDCNDFPQTPRNSRSACADGHPETTLEPMNDANGGRPVGAFDKVTPLVLIVGPDDALFLQRAASDPETMQNAVADAWGTGTAEALSRRATPTELVVDWRLARNPDGTAVDPWYEGWRFSHPQVVHRDSEAGRAALAYRASAN